MRPSIETPGMKQTGMRVACKNKQTGMRVACKNKYQGDCTPHCGESLQAQRADSFPSEVPASFRHAMHGVQNPSGIVPPLPT